MALEHAHQPTDFSTLTRRLRPERGNLAALSAMLVVAMTLPLAGPLLLGRFVDAAIDGEAAGFLVWLAVGYLLVSIVGDGLQLVVTWFSVKLAWRVGNRLRSDLCQHALSLDLAWHGENSAGKLIERGDGGIDAVTRFSSSAVVHLLGNAILYVGTLVIVTIIDWRIGALVAVVAVLAIAVLLGMRRWSIPYRDEEREVQGALYGDIEERLGGLEDLRANGAGRWAVHQLHRHSARWWKTSRQAAARGDGALVAANIVFAVGTAAVLAVGIWLQRSDAISIGTVLALFRYLQLIRDPLWRLAEQLAEMQKAVAGTRRAARLLATESQILDGDGVELPDGALSIELDDVSFGYGTDQPVLQHVNLRFAPGTRIGVVGRTGSGKTSLGRLLLRLWDPERGTVRVGGIDLRWTQGEELRRRLAVVTQDVEIFRATVRDNVTLFGAVEASGDEIARALDQVGLGVWLAGLPAGLDTVLHGSDELSAGEAQLLAFARVLLTDPGLVVLDEASSRLDPATEERLSRAIDRMLEGRTALVVAHRLSTLDQMDEIVVMDSGRVAECGERAVLANDPASRFAALLAASQSADGDHVDAVDAAVDLAGRPGAGGTARDDGGTDGTTGGGDR